MKKLTLLLFISFIILKSYSDTRELKFKGNISKYYLIPFSIRLRVKKYSLEDPKISEN